MNFLRVTIIEARKFQDKTNLYMEIYLNKDYKQRTTTIKDSNHPKWNETFILYEIHFFFFHF